MMSFRNHTTQRGQLEHGGEDNTSTRTESVHNDSREGSEGNTVREGQRSRHVESRILPILLFVEYTVCEDAGRVVHIALIVPGEVRRDGEVSKVQRVGDY